MLTTIHALGLDEASEQIAPFASVRYVQLERGAACVRGAFAQLERLNVGRFGGDRNRIVSLDADHGRVMAIVPVRGLARVGTATVQTEDTVVVHGAARLVAFADRQFLPLVLSARIDEVSSVAEDLQIKLGNTREGVSLLRVQCAQVGALALLVDDIFEEAAGLGAYGPSAVRLAELETNVLEWCATLLSCAPPPRDLFEGTAVRRRAAWRAREFIDAHLEQPLSLAQICRASYASARALEYGFREMFELSPMAYVRFARLSRVRRDLYSSQRPRSTVTRLAMKWGFWHLGQFSKDYCALFGELPSTTLGKTGVRERAAPSLELRA